MSVLSEDEIKSGATRVIGTRIRIEKPDPENPAGKLVEEGYYVGKGLASSMGYEESSAGRKPTVSFQYTVFYYITSDTRQLKWFDPIKTTVFFID